MILCGTGHRPNKLGGYSLIQHNKLVKIAEKYLTELKPDKVISGMALGWDTALADATLNLSLHLIVAIPFDGQELMWPKESQEKYRQILAKSSEIKYISDKGYSPYKMQIRNEWMVDNSDIVLAMWDGSKGGTYNCIQYAKKMNKQIINAYNDFKTA